MDRAAPRPSPRYSADRRPIGPRRPPARRQRAARHRRARSSPPRRTMCVSGDAASSVRNVSTIASSRLNPSARAFSSAGTPRPNVVSYVVAYSRATPSRSAASRIASSSVTVGSAATSCSSALPSPPGLARRIARYTWVASPTVVSERTGRPPPADSAAVRRDLEAPGYPAAGWRPVPAVSAAGRCRDWCWRGCATPLPQRRGRSFLPAAVAQHPPADERSRLRSSGSPRSACPRTAGRATHSPVLARLPPARTRSGRGRQPPKSGEGRQSDRRAVGRARSWSCVYVLDDQRRGGQPR